MIDVNIKLKRDNFDVVINESFGSGITGVFGPSGSGKTSLMHSISGLAHPQEGEITINNKTIFSKEKRINVSVEKRNIGYVFQEGRLFPHMTVEKNLRYGVKKNKRNGLTFEAVVELLNLSHILTSKPANISGGERQRTALGRSLLSSPDILLLDEPFSAVDANLREQILPFLLKIHKTVQIPLLVVSHDITDLLKLTSRLCLINNGRCIGHDNYHNLLQKPDLQGVFGKHSLINSITLKVAYVEDNGLAILSTKKNENQIKVLCENSIGQYDVGQEIMIFIRPDDVALSNRPLEGITIQNQLEGTIAYIIERNNSILCMVDVGFPLVVEITAASLNRMDIINGSKVWCLFKSAAIDVAG